MNREKKPQTLQYLSLKVRGKEVREVSPKMLIEISRRAPGSGLGILFMMRGSLLHRNHYPFQGTEEDKYKFL